MKLLMIHGSSGTVSQSDLENILSMDARIQHLQETRGRIAAGVLCRITAGAPVEEGPRGFRLEESYSGAIRKQKLTVE